MISRTGADADRKALGEMRATSVGRWCSISARDFVDDQELREELEIVSRIAALRKQRRIGVVLADSGRYWIAERESDPWGSRVHYTVAQLRELAEKLEKKPPVGEVGSVEGREVKSA